MSMAKTRMGGCARVLLAGWAGAVRASRGLASAHAARCANHYLQRDVARRTRFIAEAGLRRE